MDRDAALLAATFASAEREDVVEDVEVNLFFRDHFLILEEIGNILTLATGDG